MLRQSRNGPWSFVQREKMDFNCRKQQTSCRYSLKGSITMNRKRFRFRRRLLCSLAATMTVLIAIEGAAAFVVGEARAQDEKSKPPAAVAAKPDDVKSMDAILAAVYDTISGPAGGRDWDRLRSLFLADARLIACGKAPQGQDQDKPAIRARVLTVGEYIKLVEPRAKAEGFFEREIARRVDRFGAVAQVFSTYELRHAAADPEPFVRGINSIQLFFDGTRWWVVTIFWDSERPGQAIPDEYLPKR
jgi:hypothetical protein